MDLVYANKNLVDQGVLQDYSFDMEYGKGSTNDFQCKVQNYNHVCDQDFILYIENTEYGGIIDRIESDVKTGEVTYSGRTWHGLLNSFVIEPPVGAIYRIFNGNAEDVLQEIINLTGVASMFEVSHELTEMEIKNATCRYEKAYDLIIRIMSENQCKIKCYWKNGKIHIWAYGLDNYAIRDEFDNTQVPFKVGITYNEVNHMICLGQGEGRNRAVIHLFYDDYGNLKPYTRVLNPVRDSDYILDKSQQVLTGREEKTEIFDEPNADITTNYLLLASKPSDWNGTYYLKYYEAYVDDSTDETKYKLIKQVFEDEYHLQYVQPNDWKVQNGYQKYYYWDSQENKFVNVKELPAEQAQTTYQALSVAPMDWVNSYNVYYTYNSATQTYSSVSGNTVESYELIDALACPYDWAWNYGSYYRANWNGVTWVYSAIEGIPKYKYELLTGDMYPSDWLTNYDDYWAVYKGKKHTVKYLREHKILTMTRYGNVIAPTYLKNIYYRRTSYNVAPDFASFYEGRIGQGVGVFRKVTTEVAPLFVPNIYFARYVDSAPAWQSGTYFTLVEDVEQIPNFVPNQYYYAVEDRYKVLVEDALEKLTELRDTSTLDIDLELEDHEYDVGDIIGSLDNVTGIRVNKMITRKTIRIKKDIVSVEHSVD